MTVAVYLTVIVPLVLMGAYTLNTLEQKSAQDAASSQLSREVARQVGEIQSLMSALGGMHYANQSDGEDAVVAFAEQLRARNPMITAIGRYRNLAPDDREQFVQDMNQLGLYNYRVTDLGKSGDRVPAPMRTDALPISFIEPMSPDLLALLGSDLASEADLAQELKLINTEHRDTLIVVPEHWPAAGQLMLFRPVYQGLHVPASVADRQAQANGGYWMIIDPAAFPGGLTDGLERYTRTLDLQSPLGLLRIAEHPASAESDTLLDSFVAPRTTQQFFKIGNSHLKLSLSAQFGILPFYLIATAAVLTLLSLLLVLTLAYSLHRERAQREREASRDTMHKALEHQANHDALTGCTNRFHFEQRLEDLVQSKRASDARHALLYMDLDQFKVVNDTAGHSAGDRLLVELTQNLQKACRKEDTLSRIGGDEFGLIMSDVSAEEALSVTHKIYELFQSLVFTDSGKAFPVRASLGLVHFDEVSDSVADVLAAADMACYAAKELGRNELFVYSADDETIAKRSNELNWLPHLKKALDQDLFRLHAQPLADVKTGRISHFEFLLRLTDDEGRETSPWRIIQAAERYGLMKDIDRWIISRAMSMIAPLDGASADMKFAINLSGQSAADAGLIDFIKQEFLTHKVDPARLCFEITETAAITHFSTAVELANSIRELGSRMALDDFGSGLSSFGYLKNLPVDMLKIDGQFIKEIASNDVDRAMVKAINDVAVSMQLTTVAEFVEDEDILSVLQEIGIDLAQGYFIGKPLPLDAALEHVYRRSLELGKSNKAA